MRGPFYSVPGQYDVFGGERSKSLPIVLNIACVCVCVCVCVSVCLS